MAQYFAIINSTFRLPFFSWEASSFRGTPQLRLATDDLVGVRSALEDLKTIQVVDNTNIEVAYFTEYDGYTSISYVGRNFSSQLEGFANELVVSLQKTSLVEQVERLDKQVNKIIDTESMSLDEFKEYKINLISEAGEQLIFTGTDVTLLNGVTKNFTYNLEDQSNLLNAIFIIQTLGDLDISLPYHSHGEPCELYNARDILAVYFTLQFFSTRIQTEVNMKLNWIRECETKEEIEAITIDTPLPEKWAIRAQAIMGPAMELAAQLQAQYFGDVEPIVEETETEEPVVEEPTEGEE